MVRRKRKRYRDRYHGFWLGDSKRDRVVADWIDEQPNVAETIKGMIYWAATGSGPVAQGGYEEERYDDGSEYGDNASALVKFDD